MAKEVVIHLQSITLNLTEKEFKSINLGEGLAGNEALKARILSAVKTNLDEGNGIEYAEEL
jgi:hypothetical protein